MWPPNCRENSPVLGAPCERNCNFESWSRFVSYQYDAMEQWKVVLHSTRGNYERLGLCDRE